MTQQKKADTFDEAYEKKDDDEAIVNMGFGRGYKLIPEEDW